MHGGVHGSDSLRRKIQKDAHLIVFANLLILIAKQSMLETGIIKVTKESYMSTHPKEPPL
jgi:hypothetical protein